MLWLWPPTKTTNLDVRCSVLYLPTISVFLKRRPCILFRKSDDNNIIIVDTKILVAIRYISFVRIMKSLTSLQCIFLLFIVVCIVRLGWCAPQNKGELIVLFNITFCNLFYKNLDDIPSSRNLNILLSFLLQNFNLKLTFMFYL